MQFRIQTMAYKNPKYAKYAFLNRAGIVIYASTENKLINWPQ